MVQPISGNRTLSLKQLLICYLGVSKKKGTENISTVEPDSIPMESFGAEVPVKV